MYAIFLRDLSQNHVITPLTNKHKLIQCCRFMSPPLRHIVLDTETTGLSAERERIIEVACLELKNFTTTGEYFQAYINPQQPVSAEALAVHGLSDEFLKPHPPFHAIAHDMMDFIGESPLVIHNAPFDLAFLHAEFKRMGKVFPALPVIDTLPMARKKFPGSPASLDALCKRFNVSLAARDKHGALIDCQLLAHVYIELLGGPQRHLTFTQKEEANFVKTHTVDFPKRTFALTEEEKNQHANLVKNMRNAMWKKYYEKID